MKKPLSPLYLLSGLLVAYLLLPVAAFVVRLPDHALGHSLNNPTLLAALGTSAITATLATLVIALLGIPLAFVLARSRRRFSRFIHVAVQLPLALPPLVSGILLIFVVGPYTPIGAFFGGQLTGSFGGIIIAQVFVAAPFLIIAARSAFMAVDPALPSVAATLGHGRLACFFRVYLPIALPGIWAGLLLSWLRAFGEFGATVILAYHPYSLPVYTFVQFSSSGLDGTRAPVLVTLLAAALVLLLATFKLPARRRTHIPLPAPAQPRARPSPGIAFRLEAHIGAFRLAIDTPSPARNLALVGPSGSGKSMTLRLLAGLQQPDSADIWHGDKNLAALTAAQRVIGYLPQEPSLLPGLTLWQQINFGVNARPDSARYWLQWLGLDGLEARYPHQLSGGQQRRVALARALASGADILLLDEPFSALDTQVRHHLQRDLRRLQQDLGITTVLVTHDPEEAALLADQLIVLEQGQALQSGPVAQVFANPGSPKVAHLLGVANVFRGLVETHDRIVADNLSLPVAPHHLPPGTPIYWSISPHRASLDARGTHAITVLDQVSLGTQYETLVRLPNGAHLIIKTTAAPAPSSADRRLYLPADAIRIWPRAADKTPQ